MTRSWATRRWSASCARSTCAGRVPSRCAAARNRPRSTSSTPLLPCPPGAPNLIPPPPPLPPSESLCAFGQDVLGEADAEGAAAVDEGLHQGAFSLHGVVQVVPGPGMQHLGERHPAQLAM